MSSLDGYYCVENNNTTTTTQHTANGEEVKSHRSQHRENKETHTEYKYYYVAGDLTQAHHEEQHSEDGPGRSEGQSNTEDAEHGDGTKQYRLPAKPEVKKIQQSGVNIMVLHSDINAKVGSYFWKLA